MHAALNRLSTYCNCKSLRAFGLGKLSCLKVPVTPRNGSQWNARILEVSVESCSRQWHKNIVFLNIRSVFQTQTEKHICSFVKLSDAIWRKICTKVKVRMKCISVFSPLHFLHFLHLLVEHAVFSGSFRSESGLIPYVCRHQSSSLLSNSENNSRGLYVVFAQLRLLSSNEADVWRMWCSL